MVNQTLGYVLIAVGVIVAVAFLVWDKLREGGAEARAKFLGLDIQGPAAVVVGTLLIAAGLWLVSKPQEKAEKTAVAQSKETAAPGVTEGTGISAQARPTDNASDTAPAVPPETVREMTFLASRGCLFFAPDTAVPIRLNALPPEVVTAYKRFWTASDPIMRRRSGLPAIRIPQAARPIIRISACGRPMAPRIS